MKTPSELYTIQEPEPAVEPDVVRVGPPWPTQVEWQDFLRRWKTQFPAGKTGV